MEPEFVYAAELIRVVDGDTIWANVDLGFRTFRAEPLRLMNIDTPEVVGSEREQGLIAKQYLIDYLGDKPLTIKTYKNPRDKYGRWLAEVWVDGVNVNQHLVDNGYAVVADY